MPCLANLGIGDTAIEWQDRFLIHCDQDMDHAVFVACGDTLQSDWDMTCLGTIVEDSIPDNLRSRFMEGCLRTLENGCPVPIDGSYQDGDSGEVLFRCVMMPVRGSAGGVNFIYGAYSHKMD